MKARLVERLLDADRKFDEEGVGEIVDDHPEEAGRGGAQGRRAAMIDVAERLHRLD